MFDLSLKDIAKDLATHKLQDANENILFQKLGTGTGNLKPYLVSTNSLSHVESFQGPLLLKKWMKIISDIFFLVFHV